MGRRLGPLENLFFAYSQLRGSTLVRAGELAAPLGLTPAQEKRLLSRLAASRMIARVRPGLYLVPEKLPLGGKWTPSPGRALDALLSDRGGGYQICGPNAFNRYGWTSQVPLVTYAYNDRISGQREIGTLRFSLIKVGSDRLGEIEEVVEVGGSTARYSSRARSLIDAVYDWSRFNSLPRAYAWIEEELDENRIRVEALVDIAIRVGDLATRRRTGALLERLGASRADLERLAATLTSSTSRIPWIPGQPKRGVSDARWGVVWNDGR